MPMSFPDLESLKHAAKVHNFREMLEGESEELYRHNLADHVTPYSNIEGHEIRTGKGWDKWTAEDNVNLFLYAAAARHGLLAEPDPTTTTAAPDSTK